ncbi:MAG: EAL domain-containing protein [Pseudolabrys sp.]
MNQDQHLARQGQIVQFGRRLIPPRACVVDNKPHVRSFLAEALDDLGFIAHACAVPDLLEALEVTAPDLIVLGPLGAASELSALLRRLAGFRGKVMLFGDRSSPALVDAHELGERLGLTMLPALRTPFRDVDLGRNLAGYLPVAPSPAIGVDVDEALNNGWLELRYQPKIDTRSLTLQGAEALVRVHHPTWGLVEPAYFIPAANDPYYHALSQFVILHAMADWMQYAANGNAIDIAVRLPSPVLADPDFIAGIFAELPAGAADGDLLIAIDCADVMADAAPVRKASAQLAFHRIGIALDAIGPEGAVLVGRRDLPVVEMKVQRAFVSGCGQDRIRQAVCAHLVAAARENGARAVAGDVAGNADFMTLRALEFDLVQGPSFAKPMAADRFGRSLLSKRLAAWA